MNVGFPIGPTHLTISLLQHGLLLLHNYHGIVHNHRHLYLVIQRAILGLDIYRSRMNGAYGLIHAQRLSPYRDWSSETGCGVHAHTHGDQTRHFPAAHSHELYIYIFDDIRQRHSSAGPPRASYEKEPIMTHIRSELLNESSENPSKYPLHISESGTPAAGHHT